MAGINRSLSFSQKVELNKRVVAMALSLINEQGDSSVKLGMKLAETATRSKRRRAFRETTEYKLKKVSQDPYACTYTYTYAYAFT